MPDVQKSLINWCFVFHRSFCSVRWSDHFPLTPLWPQSSDQSITHRVYGPINLPLGPLANLTRLCMRWQLACLKGLSNFVFQMLLLTRKSLALNFVIEYRHAHFNSSIPVPMDLIDLHNKKLPYFWKRPLNMWDEVYFRFSKFSIFDLH